MYKKRKCPELSLAIHGPDNMCKDLLHPRHVFGVPPIMEYFVHLLQGLSVGLRNEEPCPSEGKKAEDCEEWYAPKPVLNERWSDNALMFCQLDTVSIWVRI